jgi:hypothetical protein
VTRIVMDTHKTNAGLSFLSSGEEVHHSLPVRADDLCFISNTIRTYPMRSPGAPLFAIPEHAGEPSSAVNPRKVLQEL